MLSISLSLGRAPDSVRKESLLDRQAGVSVRDYFSVFAGALTGIQHEILKTIQQNKLKMIHALEKVGVYQVVADFEKSLENLVSV